MEQVLTFFVHITEQKGLRDFQLFLVSLTHS